MIAALPQPYVGQSPPAMPPVTRSATFLRRGPDLATSTSAEYAQASPVARHSAATAFYRVYQPARALAAAGYPVATAGLKVVRLGDAFTGRIIAITTPGDTLLFHLPQSDELLTSLRLARADGRRVLVELDDDYWSLPPRDGVHIGPASRDITADNVRALTACCREAHAVIVTTPALAAKVRAVTGQREIAVIPNAIDPALMPPEWLGGTEAAFVVGWAGSESHREDFALALPALAALAAEPGVRLRLHGGDLLAGSAIPHEHLGWTHSIPEHYRRLAHFDVAYAPLAPRVFNASKSSVKWLEYGYLGIPAVLSDVGPYRADVRHGVTGLLAGGAAAFRRELLRLVCDRGLAAEIGAAVQEEVHARHLIAQRVRAYAEVLFA